MLQNTHIYKEGVGKYEIMCYPFLLRHNMYTGLVWTTFGSGFCVRCTLKRELQGRAHPACLPAYKPEAPNNSITQTHRRRGLPNACAGKAGE